jgi:Putative auto-transporter adhesin, head GIN domain
MKHLLHTSLAFFSIILFTSAGIAQKSYKKITITGSLDVAISQSGNTLIVVGVAEEGSDPDMLSMEETGNEIVVSNGGPDDTKSVTINTDMLQEIEIAGSVNVVFKSYLKFNTIKLTMSGSSDAPVHLDCKRLVLALESANNLTLDGTAGSMDLTASGSSDLYAKNFIVQTATVKLEGATNAWINVKKSLKASVSGSGDLYYKSYLVSKKPNKYLPLVSKKVSGAGSIRTW